MFDREKFEIEKAIEIQNAFKDPELLRKGRDFIIHSDRYKYGYYWTWMGLPIIQMPEDIVLTQEIMWETKPDYVIEAGIAWGGSLALYASFQELQGFGKVIGIDVTIPNHNKQAILNTPVSHRITLVEGSSTDPEVFDQIASQIPEGSSYKLVSFPHPNNLIDIFVAYTGEKVIEQGQISSNISSVADRLTNQSSREMGRMSRKVLIKVGNKSIWLQMKSISEQNLNQDVGIKAVFNPLQGLDQRRLS